MFDIKKLEAEAHTRASSSEVLARLHQQIEILARLHQQIEISSRFHQKEIREGFHRAIWDVHCRHDRRLDERKFLFSIGDLNSTSYTTVLNAVGKDFSLTRTIRLDGQEVFRYPEGKANPSSEDFYINVPLILKIWLRSTSVYRFLRVLWRGTKS